VSAGAAIVAPAAFCESPGGLRVADPSDPPHGPAGLRVDRRSWELLEGRFFFLTPGRAAVY
jgi:hypothetical protein